VRCISEVLTIWSRNFGNVEFHKIVILVAFHRFAASKITSHHWQLRIFDRDLVRYQIERFQLLPEQILDASSRFGRIRSASLDDDQVLTAPAIREASMA
jgi:hypothetical protein